MPLPRPSRFPRRQTHLLASLALVLAAGAVQGQETDKTVGITGLRLSGFGSLGLSHVDAPAGWGYRRELGQPRNAEAWRADIDTRLGVQLNYRVGKQLELVAQAIAKRRGGFAADHEPLEWAYASYRPSTQWTLRAGRVNVDAFLMADYRNVGYGYLAARPPVELYARLPTSLDGADAAYNWAEGDAQWRAKLMVGRTRIGDTNSSKAGRLNAVVAAMVSREAGGLLLRASVSRARLDIDHPELQPGLAALARLGSLPVPTVAAQARMLRERLSTNGITAIFAELGLRYELGDWQWSAEFVRVSAAPLTIEKTAYASLGHRLGDWTPYVSLGWARNAVVVLEMPAWSAALTPVIGPAGAAQAQGLANAATRLLNGARMEQTSLSAGVRWDFHPQAALKLQWDHVRVPKAGGSMWVRGDTSAASANVASAVVDFIF